MSDAVYRDETYPDYQNILNQYLELEKRYDKLGYDIEKIKESLIRCDKLLAELSAILKKDI